MASIEEQVAFLMKNARLAAEAGTARIAKSERDEARFLALYSIVQELAERAGVTREDLRRHFEVREEFWHAKRLEEVERNNPSLAARIDLRSASQDAAPPPYPPIFSERGQA